MSNARDTAKNLKTGLNIAADGTLVDFQKDGSSVGSISTASELAFNTTTGYTSLKVNSEGDGLQYSNVGTRHFGPWLSKDNAVDLGRSNGRFKDLYLGGALRLGGTGSSNAMYDYEIGTWTPQVWKTSQVSMQSAIGSYLKVGDLVWLSAYLYHGSCSTSGSDAWEIRNIPFNVQHLSIAAYQFVPTGYMNLGGSHRINDHTRWQANHNNKLTLYADFWNTNNSSQAFETSFTGCLRVA